MVCVSVGGLAALSAGPAVAAAPPVVSGYNSIPSPLPGNVVSVGYEATGASELGDSVGMTTSGHLDNEEVVLSSWGCEPRPGGVCTTTTPGSTFSHPMTFNVYAVGIGGQPGTLLATKTQNVNVPYWPVRRTWSTARVVVGTMPGEDVMAGMGDRGIMISGGTLNLHGDRTNTWTKLASTAKAGSASIQVLNAAGWRVGNEIVLASTDYDPRQAERRSIAAISADVVEVEGRKDIMDHQFVIYHYFDIDDSLYRIKAEYRTENEMEYKDAAMDIAKMIYIPYGIPKKWKTVPGSYKFSWELKNKQIFLEFGSFLSNYMVEVMITELRLFIKNRDRIIPNDTRRH